MSTIKLENIDTENIHPSLVKDKITNRIVDSFFESNPIAYSHFKKDCINSFASYFDGIKRNRDFRAILKEHPIENLYTLLDYETENQLYLEDIVSGINGTVRKSLINDMGCPIAMTYRDFYYIDIYYNVFHKHIRDYIKSVARDNIDHILIEETNDKNEIETDCLVQYVVIPSGLKLDLSDYF